MEGLEQVDEASAHSSILAVNPINKTLTPTSIMNKLLSPAKYYTSQKPLLGPQSETPFHEETHIELGPSAKARARKVLNTPEICPINGNNSP